MMMVQNRDIDLIKGIGLIDEGKTRGQFVGGDAQAQHFLKSKI